jgi:hypothetical protein
MLIVLFLASILLVVPAVVVEFGVAPLAWLSPSVAGTLQAVAGMLFGLVAWLKWLVWAVAVAAVASPIKGLG